MLLICLVIKYRRKQDNIVTLQLKCTLQMKIELGFQGSGKLAAKDFRNQYYVCAI